MEFYGGSNLNKPFDWIGAAFNYFQPIRRSNVGDEVRQQIDSQLIASCPHPCQTICDVGGEFVGSPPQYFKIADEITYKHIKRAQLRLLLIFCVQKWQTVAPYRY